MWNGPTVYKPMDGLMGTYTFILIFCQIYMQFKLHIHVKQGFNYVKNALYRQLWITQRVSQKLVWYYFDTLPTITFEYSILCNWKIIFLKGEKLEFYMQYVHCGVTLVYNWLVQWILSWMFTIFTKASVHFTLIHLSNTPQCVCNCMAKKKVL